MWTHHVIVEGSIGIDDTFMDEIVMTILQV